MVRARAMSPTARNHDKPCSVQILQPVLQHWPIMFLENIFANVDHKIFANTQNIVIECRMVNLAQSESIAYDGISLRMPVRDDVRSVQ